jgi:T4 RnlA family RNA ligase
MDLDFNNPKQVMLKMDGCFPSDAHLNLWDGGTIKIGEVVRNKLTPTLIGQDSNGKFVPCTVTDWHNNGTKQHWIKITFEPIRHGQHTNYFRVTPNHHIKINGEFKAAIEAKINDTLTHYIKTLSDKTLHFIKSSILGDGSISRGKNTILSKKSFFRESHQIKHKEYVKYIQTCLGTSALELYNVTGSGYNAHIPNTITGVAVSTKNYSILSEIRTEWYVNNIKQLPADISWIDNFSIAKWYMDDGNLVHHKNFDAACFYTNSFCKNDVERLATVLQNKYGVTTTVFNATGWCIRLHSKHNTADLFWKSIAPHIHPSMRYKLPIQYHAIDFIPYYSDMDLQEEYQTISVKIINIEHLTDDNYKFWGGKVGFDITTTTSNYCVKGVLVHNSLISTFLHGVKHGELSTGELRLKSKTALASDQAVAAMKWLALPENIAFKCALETMARWNLTCILEWVSPDNRIVIGYENPALVVLAVRDNINGGYEFPGTLIGELPILRKHWVETYNHVTNMSEFIENAPGLQGIEGFVIQLASGQYVKIKTTAYLALHHTKDSINSPRRLFACVLEEASDDLRSLFADDPLAIATIQAMEDQVEKWHNHLATTVEDYYNANKHLERKEYAIKGQQELDSKGFGLAMMKYLGKEVSYKAFMLKNYKLYGIKDDEPTLTTEE